MMDRDALIRRIARHEFPDPRVVRQSERRGPGRSAQAPTDEPTGPPPVAYDEPGGPSGPPAG